MRLRNNISSPIRFDEEIILSRPADITKPAHPALMAARQIPFNPNNPPAAFPSLPLTGLPINTHASVSEQHQGHPRSDKRTKESQPRLYRRSAYVWEDLRIISAPLDYKRFNIKRTPEQAELYSRDLWISLPLSLQCHIYNRLVVSHSENSMSKILGLPESKIVELRKAISHRIARPESLPEIWDSCVATSYPALDVIQDASKGVVWPIAPDVFHQNLDNMVFASRYETAYAKELKCAKEYLESRNIPSTVLGSWIPDCVNSEGSEYLVHLPDDVAESIGIKLSGPTMVSTSLPVQTQNPPKESMSSNPPSEIDFHEVPRGIVASRSTCNPSMQGPQTINLGSTVKRRHPLATVTLHDNTSIAPATPQRDARDQDDSLEPSSPTNPSSRKKQQHRGNARSAGVMGLRDRSSLQETEAMKLLRQEEEFQNPHLFCNDTQTAGSNPNSVVREKAVPSKASPMHLVLKINNRAAFAKILEKNPSPSYTPYDTDLKSWHNSITLRKTSDRADYHRAFVSLKYSPEKFKLMQATRLSPSTDKLLDENIREHLPRRNEQASLAQNPYSVKRKASQTNISAIPAKRERLLANDIAQTLIGEYSDAETGTDTFQRHIQVKNISEQPFNHLPSSTAAITPSKAAMDGPVIQSIETVGSPSSTGKISEGLPGLLAVHTSPSLSTISETAHFSAPHLSLSDRAPSFSPIPENEHLAEYQALLKAEIPARSSAFQGVDRPQAQPNAGLSTSQSRDFDRSPSFSPIPENEHLGEYQGFLRTHQLAKAAYEGVVGSRFRLDGPVKAAAENQGKVPESGTKSANGMKSSDNGHDEDNKPPPKQGVKRQHPTSYFQDSFKTALTPKGK